MRKVFAITAALALLGLGIAAQAAITIETVRVGDPGNAADTRVMSGDGTTGYGSVSYAYNIGKYEVTAGQYTAFLNAVAATDTYGLYDTEMSRTDWGSGITRSGASGSYTYSVANDFVNRPVNLVSFWDSCRFANWLGNGQGTGSTETGAYTLTTSGIANNTITRNSDWKWAVTSEDEWYKAAYYKGGSDGYWLYTTSSDTAPGRDMADASGNNANYWPGSGSFPIDSGKYTTVVGEFQNSHSPYGTFDQGGNVEEWNEAIIGGVYRGLRGSAFDEGVNIIRFSDRTQGSGHGMGTGFRVSQAVPEPPCISALLGGLMGLIGLKKRKA